MEFIHGRPNARIDYEGILGCPVRFRAEWDAVVFSEETLRLPVIGADNKLLRVLEAACRRIVGRRPARRTSSTRSGNTSWSGWPRGRRLRRRRPPFNMSTKTLERRLGERGTSYRELVDDIRCDLAKHYLANTDLRLHQIAYCAGLFRAGAAGAGFQTVDRQHAHAVPPQAAVTGPAKKF